MNRIVSGASPASSRLGVEYIKDKDIFSADLARLDRLRLSTGLRADQKARRYLAEFRQLARAYVRMVIQFNADRTKTNAADILELSKIIRSKINKAQYEYSEEPTFSRTAREKLSNPEHVGTIFNSIFANFAVTRFFPDYLKHYAVLERELAAEGVNIDSIDF
ncbi:MAG: hypothetical protein OXU45_01845 [Candidatus Melainabacteria bacterium]|nr:hypothetical protein [Candidatus Melainabacteria bacterium]